MRLFERLFKLTVLIVLLTACGSKQLQESTQEVYAHQAHVESSQDAVQSKGANVKGKVENVVTENTTGVPVYWFIIGALIFGMVIPQPSFMKLIF